MDANSLAAENQDVDKSLFDAEQFLSNFTSLREECERYKAENHELQLRVQQLTQDQNQLQIDKQNLERHIQKETLRHKEAVWNLKLEIQKSQEERLSWKEKFLDLCIKSSQNNGIVNGNGSCAMDALEKDKKGKRAKTKRGARKKVKIEQKIESGQLPPVSSEEDVVQTETALDYTAKNDINDPTQNDNPDIPEVRQVVVESLSLETSLHEETTNMRTVDMVASLDTKFNASSELSQTHDVTTDTGDYYSLQAAPFNLDNQGQPVSGNTTTFILQTSDATFCATAVMDDQQRATFTNTGVPFELKTSPNTFASHSSFPENITNNYESDSDENTEFNHRCSMCNFTYSDQHGLDKHIKAKHSAKTNFCKECGKAYSTKGSLAQHVHHYHRHPMAYNCDVCDKKFNRKDFLIKHVKTHTQERAFPCSHCDKQFKTSASLSAHVNGTHNQKRRFVCDFCGMRTSWRLSYLEHMKLHTGEPRKNRPKKEELGQHEHQSLHPPDLQQLVSEQGAVVQFITTANG